MRAPAVATADGFALRLVVLGVKASGVPVAAADHEATAAAAGVAAPP